MCPVADAPAQAFCQEGIAVACAFCYFFKLKLKARVPRVLAVSLLTGTGLSFS
jgi:hypothetical protein